MAAAERVHQQVLGIIAETGLQYREGDGFIQVLAPGLNEQDQSTAVRIFANENDEGKVAVHLVAPVLFELPEDHQATQDKLLPIVNRLNQQQVFGRWVYYPGTGTLVIEHALGGDELDESDLLPALFSLGQSADEIDDSLQEELGIGTRLFEPDVSEEVTT